MSEYEFIQDGITYVPSKVIAKSVDLTPDYISRMCREGLVQATWHRGMWYVNEKSLADLLVQKRLKQEAVAQAQSEKLKRERELAEAEARAKAEARAAAVITEATLIPRPPTPTTRTTHFNVLSVVALSVFIVLAIATSALALSQSTREKIAAQFPFQISALTEHPQLPYARTQLAQAATSIPNYITQKVQSFFCWWLECEDSNTQIAQQPARPAPRAQTQPIATSSPRAVSLAPTPEELTQQRPPPPSNAQLSAQTVVTQPVIERVVETVRTVVQGGVDQTILDARLAALNADLTTRMNSLALAGTHQTNTVYNTVSQALNIEELTDLILHSPVIDGASITGGTISGASISGTISALINTASAIITSLTATELVATNATTTNATTTNLFVSGTTTLGSSTGVLQTTSGVVSSIANGSAGQVLKIVGGTPTWSTDLTGSGGGSSAWATTTDDLAIYPSDLTDVILIATNATSTTGNILEVAGASLFRGAFTAYNTATAPQFTATSTSGTSTFPRLAISTALGLGSDYLTDITGAGLTNSSGALTLDTSGDWTGTLDALDGSFYLANSFATSSANYWQTTRNFYSTTSADYWKSETNFFSTTSADAWKLTRDFFSTTSAAYFSSLGLAFATTSSDAWKDARNFFSTTSADYWETQQAPRGSGFATTSADYWKTVRDFFSTTSASFFLSENQGPAFSSTSASYLLSTYEKGFFFSTTSSNAWKLTRDFFSTSSAIYFSSLGLAFSTTSSDAWKSASNFFSSTSADYLVHSSTTIPKTYTANTFSLLQTFNSGLIAASSTINGNLVITGNATATNATTTTLFASLASTTNFFAQSAAVGTLSLGNALGATNGGTGISTYTIGDILYADSASSLVRLPIGVAGTVLKVASGVPVWGTDLTTGGGGGATAWSTTTDSLAVYPSDTTDVILVGTNATSSLGNILEVAGRSYFSNNIGVGTSTAYSRITAWGTGSLFEAVTNASSTIFSIGQAGATTTNLAIAGITSSILKTNLNGSVVPAIAGTDYVANTSGDWTGTLDGLEGSFYLANSFSTTSANYWSSLGLGFSTTSADHWKTVRDFFSSTSAQYFIHSSTTIPKTYTANTFAALQTFANASSTLLSSSYASSTSLIAGTASSTNLFGAGLALCQGGNVLTYDGAGRFGCVQDQTAAGQANDFLFATNYSQTAAATTSPIWAQSGLFASSTSHFVSFDAASATITSATTTSLAVTGVASTSNIVVSNFFTLANLSGILKATAGAVATALVNLASDVSGILPVTNGGTGWDSIASAAIPYGNGTSQLATTTAGSNGQVLALLNGVPTWAATSTLASISGTLDVAKGGTGATSFFYGLVLSPGGTSAFTNIATSSLGLLTSNVAEGSNLYYLDVRVQTYLSGVEKGFFFSTTSATNFSSLGLAFSTTSNDYWQSQRNFFSTTSASYFSSLGLAFSTTSTDYWKSATNFFSTTSAIYFADASTTIPKTYTANTFTAANAFSGDTTLSNATTSFLFVKSGLSSNSASFGGTATSTFGTNGALTLAGSLNGPLDARNGVVGATTSIGILYGGTGLTGAPSYGQLLLGNSSGGYTLTATSSLGLANFAYLFPANATSTTLTLSNGLLSLASSTIGNDTQTGGLTISGGATTTGALIVTGTSASSTFAGNVEVLGALKVGTGSIYLNGSATSTFTAGFQASALNITSTTATSTFANGLNLSAGCFAIGGTCISGGGGSGIVGSGTTGQFPYYAADGTTLTATSSLFLATSGNVGIGTTSPFAKLSIHANNGETNKVLFAIASSTASATTTHLIVTRSGEVGIGNSSPSSVLHVKGTTAGGEVARFEANTTNDTTILANFMRSGGAVAADITYTTGNHIEFGTNTNHDLDFKTNNAVNMTIDSTTGGVGIGDTTPTEATLVLGSAGAGNIFLTLDTAGTTNNAVCWDNAGATLLYDCDSTPADYAESYSTEIDVEFGDIVMTTSQMVGQSDGTLSPRLAKARRGHGTVLGIASNNYHDFTSAGLDLIGPEDHPLPVALNGRVPMKVNLEGGDINVGDALTLSSVPGVGTRATTTDIKVGIALEPYTATSTTTTILVFVDNGYYLSIDFSALAATSVSDMGLSTIDAYFSSVIDRIRTWLADAANGIAKIVSDTFVGHLFKGDRAEVRELCVEDICVTRDQFAAVFGSQSPPSAPTVITPITDSNQPSTTTPSDTKYAPATTTTVYEPTIAVDDVIDIEAESAALPSTAQPETAPQEISITNAPQ